jgi:hypothetical protein
MVVEVAAGLFWFGAIPALESLQGWVVERVAVVAGRAVDQAQPVAGAAPAQSPPEVGVADVLPREVALPVEYAGRVVSPREV